MDNFKEMKEILDFLLSLGGSGLFGAGLFGTIYLVLYFAFPGLLLTLDTFPIVLLIGGLVVGGLQRLVEPVLNFLSQERKQERKLEILIGKLEILRCCLRENLLSHQEASELVNELLKEYLLEGESIPLPETPEQPQLESSTEEEEE